jgi:hypothetical protein
VCAAMTQALAGPLCGGEQVPAALTGRIGQALHLLSQGASTGREKQATRSVRLAMKQLQRSAAIAGGAAKRGRISAACAEAIGRAVGNAQSQAEPWLLPAQ